MVEPTHDLDSLVAAVRELQEELDALKNPRGQEMQENAKLPERKAVDEGL